MTSGNGFPLSNIRYLRELKLLAERASRDELSGLLNRETATDYIRQCLSHMRQGDACALFIIDLDNFKQVNDALGHRSGDKVIRLAGRALSGCFRPTDIVGRLGGDEFFAFLSGRVDEDDAREKARAICESLQFSLGANPAIHVSASVGVRLDAAGCADFDELYKRADAALYAAKAQGRNRYFISAGENDGLPPALDEGLSLAPVQLRALLDNMEEGVALLDVGSEINVIYASPALYRMMGVDEAELPAPCELSVFSGTHPDDVDEYERRLRGGLACGKAVEYEHRFAWGCGWRWCRVRAVRTPASDGRTVMLALVRDISGARRREDRQQEEAELLRLALERGARVLWDVDVASREFRLFSGSRLFRSAGVKIKNFPEGLIDKGWVHPRSAARFREFGEALLGGRPAGGGAFVLRHKMSRKYAWFSLYYRVLPDRERRSPRVVGVAEPLSGGMAGGFGGKDRLWEALLPNLFCYVRLNLSANRVDALWSEGRTFTEHLRGVSCDELLLWERKRLFLKEDREAFLHDFGRRSLLDAFERGEEWVYREYRRVDAGGMVRWLSYAARLTRDPFTGDVLAFGFLQDAERRREREASLADSSRDMADCGVYSADMAARLAENLLESGASSRQMLAVVRVFDVDGPDGRRRRNFVAMAFSLLLGSDCVIGRRGEDSFTVFRADAPQKNETRQRVEETFAFARLAVAEPGRTPPRFVAAVVCADLGGADYDALVAREEKLCDAWSDAPSDVVAFLDSPFPSEFPVELPALPAPSPEPAADAGERADAMVAAPLPSSPNPLSEEEKDVALACLDALLMEDSLDVAMAAVLRHVGAHYDADRVYTLAVDEDGRVVRATHEWVAEGRRSLVNRVSGMSLDRLPLLRRCLRENAPLLLRRKRSGNDESGCWSFAAFPLAPAGGGPDGLLCVENPRRPMRVDAFSAMLLPHVERALRRFGASGPDGRAAQLDSLTGLQNLRAYMDKACRLTSDVYSSLGAFILDIPHLAAAEEGACNPRLLLYLAETLRAVFGKELLFRTRSDEFVALCPNCSQEVFFARVLRAQSMLQRRYPGQLRFGYTWAEGLFSGDRLVKEARTVMLCGQLETSAAGEAQPALGVRGPGMTGSGGLERFTMFLQPKVDLRDGSLVGAEALVRGLDGAGTPIPPARFIEAMEKTGAIRELDLYMFNMALAAMDDWRRKGWKIVPLSVNFSRATLFSASAPGSVLALFSRYPLLSPGLVEIEVSENAGDVQDKTLERAMAGFRPFGVRFGLDDFGTRYANLSVFANVAFDTVKLDRSLIRGLAHNPVGRALVGDLVRLCDARGMSCVAEGVENLAQAQALLAEGCVLAQGFYYGRPMSVTDFERKYLNPERKPEGEAS